MDLPGVRHVDFAGGRIGYREAGEGPALVFLHGLGGNSASWEPQLAVFSSRFRTIAWDLPGFGASDPLPLAEPATGDYGKAFCGFLDVLGIGRAHLVGTSYGTVILAEFARAWPDRVASLIFACGVTGFGRLQASERAALRATRRKELAEIGQRRFAETRNAAYLGKGAPAAVVAQVVAIAGSADPAGYLQAYGALTESDIFASLAHLRARALVLSGSDDPIARPADCERVARALSGAEYRCIDGVGHYANLEQADQFNRIVGEFIARADAAS